MDDKTVASNRRATYEYAIEERLEAGAVLTGSEIKSVRAGKVSPKKALVHPKLPDQNQVRRIFNEIESQGERIELNLYIVGEMAEGEETA